MSTADRVKQQVLDYIKSSIRGRFPEITDSNRKWYYLLYEW